MSRVFRVRPGLVPIDTIYLLLVLLAYIYVYGYKCIHPSCLGRSLDLSSTLYNTYILYLCPPSHTPPPSNVVPKQHYMTERATMKKSLARTFLISTCVIKTVPNPDSGTTIRKWSKTIVSTGAKLLPDQSSGRYDGLLSF